jgi:hypothetical protein
MSESLPEWARFFRSQDRLDRFEAAVIDDFAARGLRIAVEDGRVIPVEEHRQMRWASPTSASAAPWRMMRG